MTWNGEAATAAVRVPVLMLVAGDDMPSDVARTREIVPGLELGRTIGSGHFAPLMVPDQVNAMIERFPAGASVAPATV